MKVLEQLIDSEADHLFRKFRSGRSGARNGHDQFNSELESLLYKFDDTANQILLLEILHSKFTSQYHKHLERCEFKEDVFQCSINSFFIKSLFYI